MTAHPSASPPVADRRPRILSGRRVAARPAVPVVDQVQAGGRAMADAPQHVMASAFENIFSWDGATAAKACRVPVLNLSAAGPLNDNARSSELRPQLVHGQTVGAGHFHQLEVPDQVNAMINRFLAISVPRPAASP